MLLTLTSVTGKPHSWHQRSQARGRESQGKQWLRGQAPEETCAQAARTSTENLPALPEGAGEDRTHDGSLERGRKEHPQVCTHGQDISGRGIASAEIQTAIPESRVPGQSAGRRDQCQIMKDLVFHAEELGLGPKLENLIVHLTFLLIDWVILSRSLNLSEHPFPHSWDANSIHTSYQPHFSEV